MDRRKFMSASVATIPLVAGCLATGEGGSEEDPSDGYNDNTGDGDDDTGNSDEDSSDEQQLYTVHEDDIRTEPPLKHSVDVIDGDLHDPDTPLRVEVTLTNTTDNPLSYGERRQALFWGARSENGFSLLPKEASDMSDSLFEFDEDAAYWVANDPFATTDDYQVEELEPDESHSETLLVLVDHQESPPEDPPEEIAFASEYRVGDEAASTDDEPAYEWGFILEHNEDENVYTARGDGTCGDFPLQYEADLTQADIHSSDEPMQLEVSLMNESEQSVSYGEGRTALFWNSHDEDFVLYPEEAIDDDFYERDDDSGLWIATDEFGMTMDYQIETLDPEETHTETNLVLIKPDDDDEHTETPPEELSFKTSVSVERIDDESVDERTAMWGFTLEAKSE